ncbi:hypothetical protein [Mycobacterium kyorinense]|uniref:hypothetical protein n=1 Tax=Mycobacterium kyorinense TaxID=487514 RepID=UPI000B293304|nr:hypothetical protein [Mycobacterium kyorinense]
MFVPFTTFAWLPRLWVFATFAASSADANDAPATPTAPVAAMAAAAIAVVVMIFKTVHSPIIFIAFSGGGAAMDCYPSTGTLCPFSGA